MSRQAGILLPLFSLRSGSDWGVGEIPDLLPWARWCAAAGFSVAQVLPVNEASRGQSSPYGALSAFAIDPVYAGVAALEDFDAAGGVAALPDADRALLEEVRAAPAVRWGDVRALKARALALAFERFVRDEWRARSERVRHSSRTNRSKACPSARDFSARTSAHRTAGAARTASRVARSAGGSAATPPAASKSSSASTPT